MGEKEKKMENLFPTKKLCTRCKGSGTNFSKGFTTLEGKIYPDRTDPCHCCEGRGDFPEVDEGVVAEICNLLLVTKGGKRTFRKTAPKNRETVMERRAYYVWRLVQFHSGRDVTLPVTAELIVHGDPETEVLDQISRKIAKLCYGTEDAGRYRWRSAMGGETVPDGEPATAYPGGPVKGEGQLDLFKK
jgi:hypothetical protein